jgi:hypothetical protein
VFGLRCFCCRRQHCMSAAKGSTMMCSADIRHAISKAAGLARRACMSCMHVRPGSSHLADGVFESALRVIVEPCHVRPGAASWPRLVSVVKLM